ncbi:MAG: hypothetical protein WBW89_00250 [Candidatus Cybelea sp.]
MIDTRKTGENGGKLRNDRSFGLSPFLPISTFFQVPPGDWSSDGRQGNVAQNPERDYLPHPVIGRAHILYLGQS